MLYIDLKVSYGESEVIGGLDLELKQGEILAVMGRNGMGKTTLFKSIIGILAAKGGSIRVDDVEVVDMQSYKQVMNGLAYVPQGRMIFPNMTVKDNILIGLETAKRKRIPDYIYELFLCWTRWGSVKGAIFLGGNSSNWRSPALW